MKVKKKVRKHFSNIRLKGQFNIVIAIMVVIPVFMLEWYIFRSMDNNTVETARTYMQDTMEREQASVSNDVEALQMMTQYMMEDSTLRTVLCSAVDGTKIDINDLRTIYNEDVRQTEQLLYSNPSVYSLRVYSISDNVTEMVPIIYRHSRMLRQKWAAQTDPTGYCFDYADHIFEKRDVQDSNHLIGLISAVDDDEYGRLGYVETAIGVSYMFPDIYETKKNESGFLIQNGKNAIYRKNADDEMKKAALGAAGNGENTGVTTKVIKIGQKRFVVTSFYIEPMRASYVKVLDMSGRLAEQRRQKVLIMIFFGAMIAILAVIVDTLVEWLLKDFYRILETVYTVQEGDISVRVPALRENETAVLGNEINNMLDEIDGLMKDNLEKGLMEKNAQIRALENQINAHFIYNVLESINMMAEIEGEYAICDAVVALGDMMRYSLRWTKGLVTIAEETEYVKNYIALMNIRLDGQLQLITDISEELMKNEIPKMTLQPLVENAVNHGYAGSDKPAEIFIAAEAYSEKVYIRVIDQGCGMTPEELADVKRKIGEEADPAQKHGYALRNISERIRIVCGEDCGLFVASEKGKGTTVTVVLPRENVSEAERGNIREYV